MHRFFCPNADFHVEILTLTDRTEIHHLRDVLRLKAGQGIVLFNGNGEEAEGTLQKVEKDGIEIRLGAIREQPPRRSTRLVLACAMPKKSKFEGIIEKCTELGADEIIPMVTERTETRLSGDRKEGKRQRYQTVAVNAAKQSRRATVPIIGGVQSFEDVLAGLTAETAAVIPCLIPGTKNIFSELGNLKAPERIVILIGPEGDFTPEEVQKAVTAGCIPVTLGPTVLKVDTAAVMSVGIANLILHHQSA
ncbi:MAG: RsmE family RNA methyltransferase [Candidatus Omnitrophota bacterium]|nr:RsmE family RNA methyltransferase [Candidatus Omnitrophota bacterium]MDZ4243118.1 RsmE family RNA methyltransferase [Candidatus Omnitrophota bacterium]